MAWNNEQIHQKHQKVYNFMKRTLSAERYDGLRAIEPCVVISNEFNKAFKFAVLGEDALYITENPPKNSKDIRIEINLASITELRWINDVPEFLNGEAKENAIHIMVCYNKPACHLTTLGGQNNSTSNLSGTTLSTNSAKISSQTIPRSQSSNHVDDTSQAASCVPICGRPLPPPPKGHESNGTLNLSLSQEKLLSLKGGLPSPAYEGETKKGRKQNSKSRSLTSSLQSDDFDFHSVDALNLSSRSVDFNVKKTNGHGKRLSSSASSAELSTQLHTNENYSSQTLQVPQSVPGGSRPLPKRNFGTKTAYDISQDKMNEFVMTVIHIYILTKDSNMFMHMRSSWNNCLLKCTLRGDNKQTQSSSRPSSRAAKDSGQVVHLFSQLKAEILSSHQMEQSFCLIQEMCLASKRSSVIKKMFWKTSDLFMFLVTQLELFLHQSPKHGKHQHTNRADELDYVVVLLETLVHMFRETEMLTSRLNVLKSNKCQPVADLVKAIVSPPHIRTKKHRHGREVSHGAQALLGGPKHMKETAKQEKEFQTLLPEITHHCIALLFELLMAAHQSNWFTAENTSLNISFLMKILEAHHDIETFIKRLMDYMVSMASSTDMSLTREQAVSLYQQFMILKNFIQHSSRLSNHLCHHYTEEFRYYIRHQILISKLPEEFPLTSPLVNLINDVMAHVLEMKTKKKPKNYLRE